MDASTPTSPAPGLGNHFLLAMPGLHDPFFAHSLIYLIEHDAGGAMGVVINQPASLTLADVIGQLGIHECTPEAAGQPLHIGGPVEVQRGLVLHSGEQAWPESVRLNDTLCLTGSRDILAAIAAGQGPARYLIILGHAGWSAGQLEQELSDNAWLTLPAEPDVLFDCPPEQRAHRAAHRLGIDLHRLSSQAGHA